MGHADPEELYEKQERIGKGSFGEVYKGYVFGSQPRTNEPGYLSDSFDSPQKGLIRRQRRPSPSKS